MPCISQITAVCTLTVRETSPDAGVIEKAETELEIGKGLDRSRYYGPDGQPLPGAARAYTMCFVHGLIANLHFAHQMNYWDSAEHLRFIIAELERGFAKVVTVKTSEPHK